MRGLLILIQLALAATPSAEGAPIEPTFGRVEETAVAVSSPIAASTSTAEISISTEAAVSTAPAPVSAPPPPWVIGEVAASGLKNMKFGAIKNEVKARKADLYDRSDLDHDIQTLLGLGDFERVGADVSSTGKPIPSRFTRVSASSCTVKLTFIVSEKPVIKKISFVGNKNLGRATLDDAVSLKTKDPLDLRKLKDDEDKILDKYHEKGFLRATVKDEIETDTTTLKSLITFRIDEGIQSKIYWVRIAGAEKIPARKLMAEIKNKRGKVFVEKGLAEDAKKIETYYLNNGYLDAVVSTPSVLTSLDEKRIYIDIAVSEGRPYRFGDTSFSGYMVYASSELVKALDYRRGKIFNQEKYEESIRNIQELYAEKGRLRARISPIKTFNPATDLMDVHFGIIEGDIVYIDHIDVEGNKQTKTHVLAREIIIKPGEMFQASRIRKSREKIMNLGFIDDVDVDIQSPADPDKVDLTFDVAEGKPGMLTAGAAYSSLDGLIGTLSLQHMNLFGRAQRASAQWSFGKRVLDYSFSWTTPWVGNSPTSLGLDAFNTRRVSPFSSSISAYTQHNLGGTVRVGPRFSDDKYQLNLSYTGSLITVSNVQPQFRSSLAEGTSLYSSVGVEFSRDTRDNFWDPTTGSRNTLGIQFSGGLFGGDIDFVKPSLSSAFNFHLFSVEDYPAVVTVSNRASYIAPFGQTKQVPVFNRFYLGGQDTLRGYTATGQVGRPTGGTVYDVANIELGFPLAREHRKTIVKIVGFFDIGSSWADPQSVGFHVGTGERDLKTDAGIGIRFTTPAFPIRLDWGYGFNHRPGERLYQINFGLGNLF